MGGEGPGPVKGRAALPAQRRRSGINCFQGLPGPVDSPVHASTRPPPPHLGSGADLGVQHVVGGKVLERLPSDAPDGGVGGGNLVQHLEQRKALAQRGAGCRGRAKAAVMRRVGGWPGR